MPPLEITSHCHLAAAGTVLRPLVLAKHCSVPMPTRDSRHTISTLFNLQGSPLG